MDDKYGAQEDTFPGELSERRPWFSEMRKRGNGLQPVGRISKIPVLFDPGGDIVSNFGGGSAGRK